MIGIQYGGLPPGRKCSTMFGGGNPFDDPFFGGDPFGGGRERRPSGRDRDRDEGRRREGREGRDPRDPFSLMDSMMGGGFLGGGNVMDMDGLGGGGGGGSSSSFTMVSSSTTFGGDGGYSRTVTQSSRRSGSGPTVSERREHLRDGRTERSSCGRRIGDRSRTITKERDARGDERTLDTIEGMDADARELDGFDDEFARFSRGGALLGRAAAPPRRASSGAPPRFALGAPPAPRGSDGRARDEVDFAVADPPPRRRSRW